MSKPITYIPLRSTLSSEQLDRMEVMDKEQAIREACESRRGGLDDKEGVRVVQECKPYSR